MDTKAAVIEALERAPAIIMFRHVALHDFLHAYRIEELLLKKEWTPEWQAAANASRPTV